MRANLIEVEKPSSVQRKLKIQVPSTMVKERIDRDLASIQRKAHVKGFRPGHAPMSMIQQYYGDEVRQRVGSALIDESFQTVVQGEKLRLVSRPMIDASLDQINANEDFTYVATIEVLPEIKVKNYTGLSVKREEVNVTEDDVKGMIQYVRESQAQLVPAEDSSSARIVQVGDFADIQMSGGVVVDDQVQPRDDMKGNQLVEVKPESQNWIPGFVEAIIGMHKGEVKTFRLTFPADYAAKELQNQTAEFTVTVNEIKEKKLPELNDDFAKGQNCESVEDLNNKVKEHLTAERQKQAIASMRGQLISQLVAENPFELPPGLVEEMSHAHAHEFVDDMKKQGYQESYIKEWVSKEDSQAHFKQKAEAQLRSTLILERIAEEEKFTFTEAEIKGFISQMAQARHENEEKWQEFYAKNPRNRVELEFNLRQERVMNFLLDKAKVQ